ncbi:MAG: hypothetical protein ACXABO_14925 [Promethearchaeota archaeon]|jgi:hypothetical protein
MDKVGSTIRLLALLTIFFMYKTIEGILANNINGTTLWALITIIYVVSITIMYFVAKRWEKVKTIQ